jgi:hypothetical protein
MDHKTSQKLASQIRALNSPQYKTLKFLPSGPLTGFHQWADDRPCDGAFLIESKGDPAIWILLVDWKRSGNYYVVVFPESRSGPLCEVHELVEGEELLALRWTYRPTKQDGKNRLRRAYFVETYGSEAAEISLPATTQKLEDFIGELIELSDYRVRADLLEHDRLPTRDGFPEGRLKQRLHYSRERSPTLVRQAKEIALKKHGYLRCACCNFDFASTYGELGNGFIEAHHTKPVSSLKFDGEVTRVEDLALVCANCHRMLHRRRPWLGMNDLTRLLKKSPR